MPNSSTGIAQQALSKRNGLRQIATGRHHAEFLWYWPGTSLRPALQMIVAALLVGAMTVSVGTAPVLPDFTIDVDPVSLSVKKPRLLVADKLTGNYSQVLTVNLT